MKTPEQTLEDMRPWFKDRACAVIKDRTPEQKGWDSGIMAVAEYVRRRTGNEDMALEIHSLMTRMLASQQL